MNKLWKAAGILGGMLVVTAGSGTLVLADETSTEVTDDNSGSSVLDTDECNRLCQYPSGRFEGE